MYIFCHVVNLMYNDKDVTFNQNNRTIMVIGKKMKCKKKKKIQTDGRTNEGDQAIRKISMS